MGEPQQIADADISEREAEVLGALSRHLTNAEIARQLFISVRTVESHVSSLLRKLGVSDRRALARVAAGDGGGRGTAETTDSGAVPKPGGGTPAIPTTPVAPPLPSPLTPFVGRVSERAGLAREIRDHRLVTAVGPGGVGKTRLALAVAADLADDYTDGVWYVDLVPVTDTAMVAPAVAAVLGLGEVPARSAEETVMTALAGNEVLVLDNCEHLVDEVAVFAERLLARCSSLRILATSRSRLLVPYERVFPVPGLSVGPDVDGPDGTGAGSDTEVDDPDAAGVGDAVKLFQLRAEAVGNPVTDPADLERVAAVCRGLDGMALAIELAAARLPTLGLDGLETALEDQLRVLSGGRRADARHGSLRATLDWSYGLAEPIDQTVLRRVSVFAAPFSVAAATELVKFGDLAGTDDAEVADALGRLANQSLVVPRPEVDGIRYRVLETVRQYGTGEAETAGETDEVQRRHLHIALTHAAELESDGREIDGARSDVTAEADLSWRSRFDREADDLRAALGWAARQEDLRSEAHTLAVRLATLLFRRGRTREAQGRFEQAGDLAEGADRVTALRQAAGAAWTHQTGDEALRLYRAAADSARADGDNGTAGRCLAAGAMLTGRCPGIFTEKWALDPEALMKEARETAGGDPGTEAALLVAEAFATAFSNHELDPVTMRTTADRAVAAAREAGDPGLESAALDYLACAQLVDHQLHDAVASITRREELLSPLPHRAEMGYELVDAYNMVLDTRLAVGDLPGARHYARELLQLPTFQDGHPARLRFSVPDALAGNWPPVLAAAERFRRDWARQGSPRVSTLGMGCSAVALVHGLADDEAARQEWLAMSAGFEDLYRKKDGVRCSTVFDTIVLFHRGRIDEAMSMLATDPDTLREWWSGLWVHWYSALWAEAATLVGHDTAGGRRSRARAIVAGNPIATAIVDRADAWVRDDRSGMQAAATALGQAGCPYQQARTLVMAGGDDAREGRAMLERMGAGPLTVLAS